MKPLAVRLFRTRIARRVFVLFVIAVLVPVAATAVLALDQIGRALTDAADQQLRNASRGSGQAIYRRLLDADEALSKLPADPASFESLLDPPAELEAAGYFTAGELTHLFGELRTSDLEDIENLSRDRTSLLIAEHPGGVNVLLARPLATDAYLIGVIASDYLWNQLTYAYDHDVCVLALTVQTPLFCSAELSTAQLRTFLAPVLPSTATSTWQQEGMTYRSAHWELFTQSGFDGALWRVVAYVDESVALASLIAFKQSFPLLLLISLIIVLLLSIWQIRRSMVPLDKLVEGTRKIADQQFDSPVVIDDDNEFGDLARALNAMADRLGHQFAELNMLAEIDRLILSADDLERVVQAALAQTQAILPCEAAGILLLDPESPEFGHLHILSHHKDQMDTTLRRVPTTEEDRKRIQRYPRGEFVPAADMRLLCGFSELGLEHVLVFPIATNQALTGALIFGFRESSIRAKERSQAGQDLADRLAVAMSASEREAILFNQAHFDPLTGLPNRQLCRDRLHQALAQARRNERKLAVLFLDLDSFKTINDSMGHSAGDIVLREVSARLLASIRDTDTVARLGGDEFVIILPQVVGSPEIEAVAQSIMTALKRPLDIQGKSVFITASLGVTIYPTDGSTVESLLRKADAAMYDAKSAGRARYVFFTNEIEARTTERLSLETDLRTALENGQLQLRYQPQLELGNDDVNCAEVLLRCVHPERCLLSPALFIPILEDIGLIDSVGDWVISTAVKQLNQWQANGLPLHRVAVNVSAQQLRQRDFCRRVEDILRAYNMPARCLELEITESLFLEDMELSNEKLRELREAGVRISIDDFGTGYSSFGYLRDLQFDSVKIDRAFIRDLPDDRAIGITKAIVAVAHTLGKSVTAEGVENESQLSALRNLGVNSAQGFLIGRALQTDDLAHWLTKRAAGEALSDTFIARALA